ncbi:MAG TPA: hypothetical protein VG297_03070 [Bryobacteraceae bacterium]|nr:hypothetical protein [Bryobacteraceae bacterium]
MNCVLCGIRKPRRYCPAVKGDICTVCCGTEREQSIDCPLECVYLQDAHEHERPPELDAATIPNQDIAVTEEFLKSNEVVMAFLALALFEGALAQPGATDYDVRDALESVIRTMRTMQSGIYYETMPENRFAAAIAAHVREKIEDLKKRELEATGASSIRDATLLGILAFLQRLEYSRNNGRKRSRAFLDFLRGFYVPSQEADVASVQLDEPRVIL